MKIILIELQIRLHMKATIEQNLQVSTIQNYLINL